MIIGGHEAANMRVSVFDTACARLTAVASEEIDVGGLPKLLYSIKVHAKGRTAALPHATVPRNHSRVSRLQ